MQLLRETWFTPTGSGRSALCAANRARMVPAFGGGVERTGATLSAPFAGVHIVEATEPGLPFDPGTPREAHLVPALEPVLAPSPGTAAMR